MSNLSYSNWLLLAVPHVAMAWLGRTGCTRWMLQVLPPLLDIIPEARLNLVIYHLRKDEAAEVRFRARIALSTVRAWGGGWWHIAVCEYAILCI